MAEQQAHHLADQRYGSGNSGWSTRGAGRGLVRNTSLDAEAGGSMRAMGAMEVGEGASVEVGQASEVEVDSAGTREDLEAGATVETREDLEEVVAVTSLATKVVKDMEVDLSLDTAEEEGTEAKMGMEVEDPATAVQDMAKAAILPLPLLKAMVVDTTNLK